MRTEELRAELRTIADAIPPFQPDVTALRRRNRNSRFVRIAAALLGLVVVASAIVVVAKHRSATTAASLRKEVPLTSLPRVDFLVVPADARAQRVLEDSPDVSRYALVFHARTPTVSAPGNGQSSLVSSQVTAALRSLDQSKSGGFAVEASGDAIHAHADLEHVLGTQVLAMWSTTPGVDVEIFMAVTATPAQVARVRAYLAQDQGDVASYTFLNHEDAYAEFKRIFADQPGLIQSTTPDMLPESFRVKLTDDASRSALTAAVQALPAVDTVVGTTPSEIFQDPAATNGP